MPEFSACIFRVLRLEWRHGNCNVLPIGQIIGDKHNKGNADLQTPQARGEPTGTNIAPENGRLER
jgi:hypothetical protein